MFRIVANLKPYTFRPGPGIRRFDAYLLSVDFVDEHGDLAAAVVRQGRTLVADNGNVKNIKRLIAQFAPGATPLQRQRKAHEERLGHQVRPGELPAAARDGFRALASRIRREARELATRDAVSQAVRGQLALRPTYLIGMEDLTMATMASISLEPEYCRLGPNWYRQLSERALDFAVRTAGGDYGRCEPLVFAGLHGIDFDTAREAGRLAGANDADGIATGLAGAMRDNDYTDFTTRDGAVVPLAKPVPRPYVRTAEIAAGLHLGYAEASGRRPRFHALGVGTPIMVVMLAALGAPRTYTGLDSKAPIEDAAEHATISLYVDRPAPVKLKTHRIAEYWLAGERAWTCRCPYCRAFARQNPARISAARRWWRSEGRPRLDEGHMQSDSPLAPLLPLLSKPPDPVVRGEASYARIGHNHWVLHRLESEARRRYTSQARLRDWCAGRVHAYLAAAGTDPNWRDAVEAAWSIVDSAARDLDGARPGGVV